MSQSSMPQSLSKLFSACAPLAASVMLVRSMAKDIPDELRSYISSAIRYLFTPFSRSTLTLVIDEFSGLSRNQIFDAAMLYLNDKISPSTKILRVSKTAKQRTISVSIGKGEEVKDAYNKIVLTWRYVCIETENHHYSNEKRCFQLTFNKKFRETVVDSYLFYVLERGNAIKEKNKEVKIYSHKCPHSVEEGGGMWGSINLEHPTTFETLAMDSELKKKIIEDLQRFLKRKEFYKKVGKAWKRGYLLYGPPGTGKSSLIAAMANYLKFDIYDLDLTSIQSDTDLIRILLSTTSRSILVIEDIDCSLEAQDRHRQNLEKYESNGRFTLSGLLNFIDGLWSSCGDERIIVFTTNHKDRLDPALLRPGRMDLHINMTYCTKEAFNMLVSTYLDINVKSHRLYAEIEGLIKNGTKITPAEVAEELMSEHADVCLEGVVKSLKRKNSEAKAEEDDGGEESQKTSSEQVQENNTIINNSKRIKTESCRRFEGFKSSEATTS